MEQIAGFAWPLPRAYSGPVSACRFEQGDVLFDDASGYEDWTSDRRRPATIVQVLDPPRSARASSGDADGGRFRSNWSLPVTVDLHDESGDPPRRIITTQGRLFTCLWRGDPAALDPSAEVAEAPQGQRVLYRRLAEAVPAFVSRFERQARAGGHSLLLLAVDDASDSSRVKAQAIESLLHEAFEVDALTLGPAEAGVDGDADEALHPALLVRGIAIATEDAEAIERRLASLLYGGGDAGSGRFSLSRHGHLAPLGRA